MMIPMNGTSVRPRARIPYGFSFSFSLTVSFPDLIGTIRSLMDGSCSYCMQCGQSRFRHIMVSW